MLFDGGIRSPLIVWGPGFIAAENAGTRNASSRLAAIDLVPSLVAFTGVEPATDAKPDGENMLDTLLGKNQESRQKPIFFSRPPDRKDFSGMKRLPDLAVREGDWKLLCDYDGSRPLLYNLAKDPGEMKNLADEKPEKVDALRRKVLAWWETVR